MTLASLVPRTVQFRRTTKQHRSSRTPVVDYVAQQRRPHELLVARDLEAEGSVSGRQHVRGEHAEQAVAVASSAGIAASSGCVPAAAPARAA